MRSLWYRLTHTPTNLADCLDLADKKPLQEVSLHLRLDELIREQWLVTHFFAEFRMSYPEQTYVVEELCGGYLDTYSEEKKRVEIERANTTLRNLTRRLEDHGIVFSGSGQQFEYHPSLKPPRPAHENPYDKFVGTKLILRDQLSIDRTVLANERTLLAYCRTSLTLILSGAGCIKLFESSFSRVAGWLLIGLGMMVAVIGTWRCATVTRNMIIGEKRVRAASPNNPPPDPRPQPGPKNRRDTNAE